MIAVASEFHDSLVSYTGSGEALVSVANRVWADILDLEGRQDLEFPLLACAVGAGRVVSAPKGCRWEVLEGVIDVYALASIGELADDDNEAQGREACETLTANLGRVLRSLTTKTSDDYPAGVWFDMTYTTDEGGPKEFNGFRTFGTLTRCVFRFRRYRNEP